MFDLHAGLLFYAAAIPAVILLGLSKGGFSGVGLLSLPLLALVISPIRAAGIILPILIVQDAFLTETASLAEVVLPAASYGEEAGTCTP